eukprot:scaffold840_cov344-Pavlova_lutheri.AAC.41
MSIAPVPEDACVRLWIASLIPPRLAPWEMAWPRSMSMKDGGERTSTTSDASHEGRIVPTMGPRSSP